jgi:co-chaperonin GroES (HSP10)
MTLRPLNDCILVALEPIDTQIGSIVIPGGVYFRRAIVLATGPGTELPDGRREPTGVTPGDRIVFHRAHGEHGPGRAVLKHLGGEMLLLKADDVLVIYEGELTVS